MIAKKLNWHKYMRAKPLRIILSLRIDPDHACICHLALKFIFALPSEGHVHWLQVFCIADSTIEITYRWYFAGMMVIDIVQLDRSIAHKLH